LQQCRVAPENVYHFIELGFGFVVGFDNAENLHNGKWERVPEEEAQQFEKFRKAQLMKLKALDGFFAISFIYFKVLNNVAIVRCKETFLLQEIKMNCIFFLALI
jgi:hypothetical protein